MQLSEGRQQFIEEWGKLSVNWGVSKTMGQVHALLLVSNCCVCSETVMNHLDLSRGNVNTNLRTLIDWGLVHKNCVEGERREFFTAEKDIWKVFKQIIKHRKKKELEPLIALLDNVSVVKADCEESDEFCKVMKELKAFTKKADSSLNSIIESENNWLTRSMMHVLR